MLVDVYGTARAVADEYVASMPSECWIPEDVLRGVVDAVQAEIEATPDFNAWLAGDDASDALIAIGEYCESVSWDELVDECLSMEVC